MRSRSKQARLLSRKLTIASIRDLLIYSGLFIVVMIGANALIVPCLADVVADLTSKWIVYEYDDLSLEDALKMDKGAIFAIAQSEEEALSIYDPSQETITLTQTIKYGPPIIELDEKQEKVVDKSPGIEELVPTLVISKKLDQSGASDSSEEVELIAFSNEELMNVPMDSNTTLLLYSNEGRDPLWATSQSITMDSVISHMVNPAIKADTQVLYYEDRVALRDLSAYKFLKQLKIPILIIIYLIGLAIILFIGLSRSFKYFDELTNAVASLIVHREQPVKLSEVLQPTQEELNVIRLSSLADERAAQAAERRKDELVAYLAHDVNTPMTSIIGYLSLLDEAPDIPEESRKRYISTALAKSERLAALIDEFFEITRYNLQAIPIERTRVDVRLLCQQIADEFYPDAEARNLNITMSAPDDEYIFVDPDKFARVLENVMRNALAHADAETSIILNVQKTEEDAPRWKFSITNEGREISAAHLQSIFDKFYRADADRNSSGGQAGLGLAIAKEIVVAHGGTIEAQSEQGKTTFTIYVPDTFTSC